MGYNDGCIDNRLPHRQQGHAAVDPGRAPVLASCLILPAIGGRDSHASAALKLVARGALADSARCWADTVEAVALIARTAQLV